MPSPVAHFDFGEGSGTTTTAQTGGYTLTNAGGIVWAPGGGITNEVTGIIGPGAAYPNWTVAFSMVLNNLGGGYKPFMLHPSDGSGYWLQHNGGQPEIWRGNALVSPTILPISVPVQLVYTVTPTHQCIYIGGILVAERDEANISFDTSVSTKVWGGSTGTLKRLRLYDVALSAAEVAALSGTPVAAALGGAGAFTTSLAVHTSNFVFYTGTGGLHAGATAVGPELPPSDAQRAWVASSARDLTRDYMTAQLAARGTIGVPWSSSIPAVRPARFFTIEELNSATEYGVFADAQLLQIRGYDTDLKRLGQTMRLIKGLWKVMPAHRFLLPTGRSELEVQDVEHAGGPSYDEDPDVPGLRYGQLISWVTVMTEFV